MAIAKMYSDPMLGTFRKMAKECTDKGHSGESYDNMMKTLARMEELAQKHSDFAKFSAQMTEEQLQLKFSQYYSEVLSSAAKAKLDSDEHGYDDENLMAMTLKAYEDTIVNLKKTQEQVFANLGSGMDRLKAADRIIPVLEKIIKLGKSGISLPKFLTQLVTEGLDRASEGMIAVRDGILFEIEISKETSIPPIIKMHEARLAAFDELAAKAPFNSPDSLEFSLKSGEIEWKYAPVTAKWRAIADRVETIFDLLIDWLDSYCSFAPYDERWKVEGDPELTKKNIRRTRGCNPGFLKERLRILEENLAITWEGIFSHTVFKFWHSQFIFPWSEERFNLMKETYTHCVPGGKPPGGLISQAETLYKEKRCANPNLAKNRERMIKVYDKYYGQGAYEKAFS